MLGPSGPQSSKGSKSADKPWRRGKPKPRNFHWHSAKDAAKPWEVYEVPDEAKPKPLPEPEIDPEAFHLPPGTRPHHLHQVHLAHRARDLPPSRGSPRSAEARRPQEYSIKYFGITEGEMGIFSQRKELGSDTRSANDRWGTPGPIPSNRHEVMYRKNSVELLRSWGALATPMSGTLSVATASAPGTARSGAALAGSRPGSRPVSRPGSSSIYGAALREYAQPVPDLPMAGLGVSSYEEGMALWNTMEQPSGMPIEVGSFMDAPVEPVVFPAVEVVPRPEVFDRWITSPLPPKQPLRSSRPGTGNRRSRKPRSDLRGAMLGPVKSKSRRRIKSAPGSRRPRPPLPVPGGRPGLVDSASVQPVHQDGGYAPEMGVGGRGGHGLDAVGGGHGPDAVGRGRGPDAVGGGRGGVAGVEDHMRMEPSLNVSVAAVADVSFMGSPEKPSAGTPRRPPSIGPAVIDATGDGLHGGREAAGERAGGVSAGAVGAGGTEGTGRLEDGSTTDGGGGNVSGADGADGGNGADGPAVDTSPAGTARREPGSGKDGTDGETKVHVDIARPRLASDLLVPGEDDPDGLLASVDAYTPMPEFAGAAVAAAAARQKGIMSRTRHASSVNEAALLKELSALERSERGHARKVSRFGHDVDSSDRPTTVAEGAHPGGVDEKGSAVEEEGFMPTTGSGLLPHAREVVDREAYLRAEEAARVRRSPSRRSPQPQSPIRSPETMRGSYGVRFYPVGSWISATRQSRQMTTSLSAATHGPAFGAGLVTSGPRNSPNRKSWGVPLNTGPPGVSRTKSAGHTRSTPGGRPRTTGKGARRPKSRKWISPTKPKQQHVWTPGQARKPPPELGPEGSEVWTAFDAAAVPPGASDPGEMYLQFIRAKTSNPGA